MTPEFNLDKADVELADDVAVALNGTMTVSATLASNLRTLSGTVTAAAGGAPWPGDGAGRAAGADAGRRPVAEVEDAETAANGTWSATVPDGTYRVGFSTIPTTSSVVRRRHRRLRTPPRSSSRVPTGTGLNAALLAKGRSAARSRTRRTDRGRRGGHLPRFGPGDVDYEDTPDLSATGAYTSPTSAPGTTSSVQRRRPRLRVLERQARRWRPRSPSRSATAPPPPPTPPGRGHGALRHGDRPPDAPLAGVDIYVEKLSTSATATSTGTTSPTTDHWRRVRGPPTSRPAPTGSASSNSYVDRVVEQRRHRSGRPVHRRHTRTSPASTPSWPRQRSYGHRLRTGRTRSPPR